MYVEPIYTYGEGNIVSYADCVGYYYKIKPINSLYASDVQLETLISTLREKILAVNKKSKREKYPELLWGIVWKKQESGIRSS